MRVEPANASAPAAMLADSQPPIARRPIVAPEADLREEIRDSVRLLTGCLGATGLLAVLLHFVTVWAG